MKSFLFVLVAFFGATTTQADCFSIRELRSSGDAVIAIAGRPGEPEKKFTITSPGKIFLLQYAQSSESLICDAEDASGEFVVKVVKKESFTSNCRIIYQGQIDSYFVEIESQMYKSGENRGFATIEKAQAYLNKLKKAGTCK